MMLGRRGIALGAALVKTDCARAAGESSKAVAASKTPANIRPKRWKRIDFIMELNFGELEAAGAILFRNDSICFAGFFRQRGDCWGCGSGRHPYQFLSGIIQMVKTQPQG
jgi:hypothetical protein